MVSATTQNLEEILDPWCKKANRELKDTIYITVFIFLGIQLDLSISILSCIISQTEAPTFALPSTCLKLYI